ncbi:MAG: ABC transporter ATP-binding protein [Pseudobdellovibrionaceae bacterium]|nr:ABC transporter ATP-binding protein [Pseudobdellovibrionaceae bacterium]
MSEQAIIEIHDLWKKFVYQGRNAETLKEGVLSIFSRKHRQSKVKYKELYHGLSLQIQGGEVVAFLGSNGSGKSTLLKLISGIYSPDSGDIRVRGRLSALIELGAGFHPEFSGRDNIYIYGQILGLKPSDIDLLLPQIIEFSELGDFVEQPVKHYSSGMYMRLAFSVAVMIDPDILVIDEILSVGDYRFAQKSRQKMLEFKQKGKTICLVSHDLDTVLTWATRVVVLEQGQLVFDGEPSDGVRFYLSRCESGHAEGKVTMNSALAEEPAADAALDPEFIAVWKNRFLLPSMKTYTLQETDAVQAPSVNIFVSLAHDLITGGYLYSKLLVCLKVYEYLAVHSAFGNLRILVFHELDGLEQLKSDLESWKRSSQVPSCYYEIHYLPTHSAKPLPVNAQDLVFCMDWRALAHIQTTRAFACGPGQVFCRQVLSLWNNIDENEIPPGEPKEWLSATQSKFPFVKFDIPNFTLPEIRRRHSIENDVPFHIVILNDVLLTSSHLNVALRSIQQFLDMLGQEESSLVSVISIGDTCPEVQLGPLVHLKSISRSQLVSLPIGSTVVLFNHLHDYFLPLARELQNYGIPVAGDLTRFGSSLEHDLAEQIFNIWQRRTSEAKEHVEFDLVHLKLPDSTQWAGKIIESLRFNGGLL